ncbi:hypothetical protein ABVK25_010661 [Lepraria finkii]|uniref:UDP-N-acetylglucosamine transferase subunit ALG14 n=1 Tax=Lepraria finkii TaxID=1340010 RepID=A0ABR4AUW1_9LECA
MPPSHPPPQSQHVNHIHPHRAEPHLAGRKGRPPLRLRLPPHNLNPRLPPPLPHPPRHPPYASPPRKRGKATHLLIVLGSGGHTAEMLSLLADIDPKSYTHRSYVVSSGDDFSSGKAEEFEDDLAAKATGRGKRFVDDPRKRETGLSRGCIRGYIRRQGYSIHTVPRARRIHQSLLTTPLSSYYCLGACLSLLLSHHEGLPDLILTNGPATALIMILASTMLRYSSFLPSFSRFGAAGKMRVVYVESWARVKKGQVGVGGLLWGVGFVIGCWGRGRVWRREGGGSTGVCWFGSI